MILDIFSELQKAQPWPANHERAVIEEALAQAKLADELGFGCWWNVEHHGAAEFSYSSAPEMMPVLLSQHTRRLRFGHSGILAPFRINHPVRIAERAAFADIVSGGRLELGLARSGGMEWDTFGVDPASSRAELREALHMIPRIWTESPFEWQSERITVPKRDIVPKPLQKPHPPLWQTCTSPESFEMAGELGVGALGTTLFTPLPSLAQCFDRYALGLARCRPCGLFVNQQRAVFTFVHCAPSRRAAIESRAGEAALWFVNFAPRIFQTARKAWIDTIRGGFLSGDPAAGRALSEPELLPAEDDLDDPIPVIRLMNRHLAGHRLDPEEVFEVLDALDSVVIGDPDRCLEKMQAYKALGADRLMCFMQFGALDPARVLESLRLTGEVLLPALQHS